MNIYTTTKVFLIFTFLLTCSSLELVFAEKDTDKQPSDIYLEYLTTAQNAKSFDEIAPYWSGWMVDSVKGKSEDERNARLKRMQESAANKKDISVTGTEKSGEFWVISLSAVYPDGQKMKGQVKVFEENGKYVIEEEMWTADFSDE